MTETTPTERRENLRLPSSRPVLMIIDHKNIYATMTDFSRHGIGFISSEKPQVHRRIEIHFDIPSSQTNTEVKPFQFKAEIRHCFTYSNESHIGVRIEQPSQEYLKLFDRLTAA